MIKGLHHNAYRCRDSEETRAWYEDFLGLPLVSAFEIDGGRALHTFFQMDDVDNDVFETMLQKARDEGQAVRGPIDHGFCRSIYFRDPNGYVVELTADTGVHGEMMDPALSQPHQALARWQTAKSG
jgi:catechol 2,3-dioxygenase-like lactoylglutathione lyase family enzyme